jgi:hypothetical protein
MSDALVRRMSSLWFLVSRFSVTQPHAHTPQALFLREGGFAGLAGSVKDVNVVLAGMGREMANQVSKRLHAKGVEHERMLFCDFF